MLFRSYGAKPVNVVAVKPKEDFKILNKQFLNHVVHEWFGYGEFQLADNFISLTLSLDNQIIHTSRMFGLYIEEGGEWGTKDDIPYFYRDFSLKSAEVLEALDKDYTLIRNEIRKRYSNTRFDFMLDYLTLDNTTNLTTNNTVLETFQNSKTLGAIQTPVVYEKGK